jgi:S1-C subfamily serine protease
VIGINTMIVGGGTGIGFAIASDLARRVSDQLIASGAGLQVGDVVVEVNHDASVTAAGVNRAIARGSALLRIRLPGNGTFYVVVKTSDDEEREAPE